MASYTSRGGSPRSLVEQRGQGVKFVLMLLFSFLVTLGLWWAYSTYRDKASQCVSSWPEMSVFTTGNPEVDQRIAWAIAHDESEKMEASEQLVTQLWEKKDISFTGKAAELWGKAQLAELATETTPWLSITQSGVIVPFFSAPEVQGKTWVWNANAQESPSLILATREGGVTVPIVTLEKGAALPVLEGARDVTTARQEICP